VNIERLEPRCLLAGVTILTHGVRGNVSGWIKEAAYAISDRLGGPKAMSIYNMEVDGGGVDSFYPIDGYGDYMKTTTGELVIRLDWSDQDTTTDGTDSVADEIADFLMQRRTTKKLAPIAEMPIHIVGHSRGGSLAAEIAKRLGRRGVIVDQVTFLDPVSVGFEVLGQEFGDPPLRTYDNVVFADDYWRQGGGALDPNGKPVNGTAQGDLNNIVQTNNLGSAHNAVTAYYVGTVGLNKKDGGDHPILAGWYGGGNPARDKTGFAYSRIGGAARPAAGLGPLGRGKAARSGAGASGAQWPGAVELKPRGGDTFEAGRNFTLTLRGGDRDGQARVSLFLDADRNPYNGSGELVGTARMSGAVADRVYTANAVGVAPGKYALAARMTDSDGQTRWFYGKSVTITRGSPVGEISGQTLTLTGTAGNDTLSLQRVSDDVLRVWLGDRAGEYSPANINRIEVLAGAGDDLLSVSPDVAIPIYAFGDAGNDTLQGGAGRDTLTGGAGRNFMDGQGGDDRINGSGAPDTLWGGEGNDRMYGNGGDDRFEGGGGVDRAFGGDGNDYLVGGGSADKLYGEGGKDTLIGAAGADLLHGGGGIDTADNDPADTRVSIEVLQ
jgi:Ca2+-binding RTX toxin-like protein